MDINLMLAICKEVAFVIMFSFLLISIYLYRSTIKTLIDKIRYQQKSIYYKSAKHFFKKVMRPIIQKHQKDGFQSVSFENIKGHYIDFAIKNSKNSRLNCNVLQKDISKFYYALEQVIKNSGLIYTEFEYDQGYESFGYDYDLQSGHHEISSKKEIGVKISWDKTVIELISPIFKLK